MLTLDDVRAVPLFANLSDADLDRLVRTCADIHLNAGEYAVHEGGERARTRCSCAAIRWRRACRAT